MTPREYDRVWTVRLTEQVRERRGYSSERGTVTRFLVQLEYCLDGEWTVVVRYDHDSAGSDEMAHDVSEDGLHVDIYRDGEKAEAEYVTGPIPPEIGFTTAEEHLAKHTERYISRFEEWHQTDH